MAERTLVEFLTARFDEDEATAVDFEHIQALAENGDYGHTNRDLERAGWWAVKRIGWTPNRVRVEVAAKRRILAAVAAWADAGASPDTHNLGASVLEALALPYTDHPDYSDGWRL